MPISEQVDHLSMWKRYRAHRYDAREIGFTLDISRVGFDDGYFDRMKSSASSALDAMDALEAGAEANADEGRMVGHYWLRAPELAPHGLGEAIRSARASVEDFAARVRRGAVQGSDGPFEHVIHVGIGGSTTGPQLACEALGSASSRVKVHFIDNADPDGIDRVMASLSGALGRTLVSIVSKSGWTPTPYHVMRELSASYARAGLDFARHAVATTMEGTELDVHARERGWLARFPIWEWVGGRTSVTSAVGLLPLALIGADVASFLDGAAAMDRRTRRHEYRENPALLLALMWHWLESRGGNKAMVILPYKDCMALFGRYVQQLTMESIGKKFDRSGKVVHQGLTVYGHKGSTDQHAYFQQLREGRADFFATFIYFHDTRKGSSVEVEPGLTLGDHLFGYAIGSRDALYERGRESITVTLPEVGPASVGALIALYERAVGLYAELVDVNAYHQPGIDKRAAGPVVQVQQQVLAYLRACSVSRTAEEVAHAIGRPEQVETVYKVLERLAKDPSRGVTASPVEDASFEERFSARPVGSERQEIVMRASFFERMVTTLRQRFPEKSFGYLISHIDAQTPVDFVLFQANIRNSEFWKGEFQAYGRYFVDHDDAGFVATPEESWRCQKEIWARGMFEVGVFHSHQRHPANFSGIDYDMHSRRLEGLWHVIVSFRNPEFPQLRVFAPSALGVREVPLRIVDDDAQPARELPRRAASKDEVVARARTHLELDRHGQPKCRDAKAVLAVIDELVKTGDKGAIAELLIEGFLRDSTRRYEDHVARDMRAIGRTRFAMGTPQAVARHFCGESPRHDVELSPFQIGAFAVTSELYALYDPRFANVSARDKKKPVTDITWFDATLFAMWMGCRLPTEAEWEFACGAGSRGEWCCDEEQRLVAHAWYSENSGGHVHDVGTRAPNALGIFDLHGNVWEWCQDGYDQDFYAHCPARDPICHSPAVDLANELSLHKVTRGGSMHALSEMCRTRYRFHEPAEFRASDLGFRLARGRN